MHSRCTRKRKHIHGNVLQTLVRKLGRSGRLRHFKKRSQMEKKRLELNIDIKPS